jgi:hypothetical protein
MLTMINGIDLYMWDHRRALMTRNCPPVKNKQWVQVVQVSIGVAVACILSVSGGKDL